MKFFSALTENHSGSGEYIAHDLKYPVITEVGGERYIAEPKGGARNIYTERKK